MKESSKSNNMRWNGAWMSEVEMMYIMILRTDHDGSLWE